MAESYLNMHLNGHKTEGEHEEKMMWKKRMVQSQTTTMEINTKFLADLDSRLEPLNPLPEQVKLMLSILQESNKQHELQMKQMSEHLIKEIHRSEARQTENLNKATRDYNSKLELISKQIYDMHAELQTVRGKIREDFMLVDTNTHDKIIEVQEKCTKAAERLHDINCDTLSLNEKFAEMKDNIIDDRLAFMKQHEDMVRMKENQEKILRLLRGPEAVLKQKDKEKRTKQRSGDSDDERSCKEENGVKREYRDHDSHSSRRSSFDRDSESHSSHKHRPSSYDRNRGAYNSSYRRPFATKKQRRSESPGPSYNNNNSRSTRSSRFPRARS